MEQISLLQLEFSVGSLVCFFSFDLQPPGMPHVDAEHRGPLVEVAALITLATMILFIASKVTTKWRMAGKLQKDDMFMILALVGPLLLSRPPATLASVL